MSDQVPFGVRQVAQGIRLAGKLLHPVFAENAEAGGVRLADQFGRKSLAHAHQCDLVRIAARSLGCCGDPLPHLSNIFRDRHKAKTTKDTKYHEGESLLNWLPS